MHKRCEPSGPFILKGPEPPKNCLKFVPTIVCRGSNQGTQICQKFVETLKNDNLRTHCQNFDKFLTKFGAPPQKQSSGYSFDKCLGFGAFLNAVRGRRGQSPNCRNFPQIACSIADPNSGCRSRSAKGVRSLFFVFGALSVTFWSLFF